MKHPDLVDALDVTVASLDPGTPAGLRDLDGRLTEWLGGHGVFGAGAGATRLYVFGSAATAADLPSLFDDLGDRLSLAPQPLTKER